MPDNTLPDLQDTQPVAGFNDLAKMHPDWHNAEPWAGCCYCYAIAEITRLREKQDKIYAAREYLMGVDTAGMRAGYLRNKVLEIIGESDG